MTPRRLKLIAASALTGLFILAASARAAKNCLAGGGFEAALGPDGTFEEKLLPENKPPASAPGR